MDEQGVEKIGRRERKEVIIGMVEKGHVDKMTKRERKTAMRTKEYILIEGRNF